MFEALNYDPSTGVITNKITRSSKAIVGSEAGSLAKGYKQIYIHGRYYKNHRIAFYKIYGYFPEQIDHINHNKLDNRIVNLRETTKQGNMRNKARDCRSKFKMQGISKSANGKKFIAAIGHEWKRIHLGTFDTEDEACEARINAELKYNYHENHGMQEIPEG